MVAIAGRRPGVLALLAIAVAGCGGDSGPAALGAPVIDPGDGGDYSVDIDPTRFSPIVDHPYLPKLPGTRWTYEAVSTDGDVELVTVEVLDETRMVMGVETIVVRDVVETADGVLVEDTFDWFAQDAAGNVWYFGEATRAFDEDGNVSESGSWEAGVDGALPGIVMPAAPTVDDVGYRQEYLAGEAEDMGQVVDLARGVVVTRDWTPLEPDVVEEKTYVDGIGFVHETKTEDGEQVETVRLVGFEVAD